MKLRNTKRRFAAAVAILAITLTATAQTSEIDVRALSIVGHLTGAGIEFTASGTIAINDRVGADLSLLAGDVALLEEPDVKGGRLGFENDEYRVIFDRKGVYNFTVRFAAKVAESDELKVVAFRFLSAPIRSLRLEGFPLGTEIEIENAAAPLRSDDAWIAHLSPDSRIRFRWKPAQSTESSELFYTADLTNIAVIAPGMIKQNQKAELQIMQGEMENLAFELGGPGEISQVEGRDLLGWKVETELDGARRLAIRFNRPQTRAISLIIRSQTALPKLPTVTNPLILTPVNATRASGALLLLSDGAVNLGVGAQRNLSQISPDQVPLEASERSALGLANRQAFAFRYAGTGQALDLQINDILPEVAVSSICLYHFGLNESSISMDMNLEIREAPLREFSLRLPIGYSILSIKQAQLADYTVSEANGSEQTLRLIFGQPIRDRQSLHIQLERNAELTDSAIELPRIAPVDARSVRGYVGITADTGIKVARGEDSGLTEVIPSHFPVKNDQLQVAFRLRDAEWMASLQVERLAPSAQAEAFHLFSFGDGIAYGSTILTYRISGAPMQSLSIQLDSSYENVDLFGPNIRDWRKIDGGYLINLNGPISGAFSLLATYEFRVPARAAQFEFSGARALDASSESGYIVFTSPSQAEFQLDQLESPLLPLEPQELPPEYQIMIDAPVLASFHYPSRPFHLQYSVLAHPREPSIDQVVELAAIDTSISKDGEVLYTADYIVKSKNLARFSMRLPSGSRLWKVALDGKEPVVAQDEDRLLVPLDNASSAASRHLTVKFSLQRDPDALIELTVPRLEAPTLQTRWSLRSDEDRQLVFKNGSVSPQGLQRPASESDRLIGYFSNDAAGDGDRPIAVLAILAALALALQWVLARPSPHLSLRWLPLFSLLVGALGLWFAAMLATEIGATTEALSANRDLVFEDTIIDAQETISLTVQSEVLPVSTHYGHARFGLLLTVALLVPLALAGLAKRNSGRRSATALNLVAHAGLAALFLAIPHGAALLTGFLGSVFFSPLVVESIRQTIASLSRRGPSRGSVTAVALGVAALILTAGAPTADAQTNGLLFNSGGEPVRSEPVHLSGVVNKDFAAIKLHFVWDAKAGEAMPLLFLPAVITQLDVPDGAVALSQRIEGERSLYTLVAKKSGRHSVTVDYQTPVVNSDGVWSFSIQSIPSLIYQGSLIVEREDCEIICPAAIAIERSSDSENKRVTANLRFRPVWDAPIVCKPLDRDTRLEKTVFYAETVNAYRPQAGTIEGIHKTTLRIAQGQLSNVIVDVPNGSTITDVKADWVESWRFDPATRLLAIVAKRPLTNAPQLIFVSQANAASLPYEASIQVVRFPEAESELGWIGLYLSSEDQYDRIGADDKLAAVNISDLPVVDGALSDGFKLRRAFRYADPDTKLEVALSKVEPEIRVESDELTSLSEDRTVHAATLKTTILRSGLFQIQLELPATFDIEKIAGAEISHWTESGAEGGNRQVTLHFKSRTEGLTTQHVTLSGPGVRESARWTPPRVTVLGAAKQSGVLTLSPELGLRLNPLTRRGVSQVDPSESGERDRSRAVYRLLESDWLLELEAEQVSPWVECSLLQDVTFRSGVSDIAATLRYSIKNAGVKQLRLRLPANAQGVAFSGEYISNYQRSATEADIWEINLDRRAINAYALHVAYQRFAAPDSTEHSISGIEALDTQVQESFLALRAKQRLDLRPANLPSTLAPIEWQQVPEALRARSSAAAAIAFRTLQPSYTATIATQRLDMAQVLPAEIKRVRLASTLSESGQILTRASFRLDSGHKPHFHVSLPPGSTFWSCHVDGVSVWPVSKDGKLLIPLERTGAYRDAIDLEILYANASQPAKDGKIAVTFLGPQCDLPLEDVEWHLYVPASYKNAEWSGTLEPVAEARTHSASFDLELLLKSDARTESDKIQDAEQLLSLGNELAEKGAQLDARRALSSAYNLSLNDLDFNEDARVQWNNLRVRQTMVGLTSRRHGTLNSPGAPSAAIDFQAANAEAFNFSRTAADALLQNANSAEENRNLSELARRFVEHQDAALTKPASLTAHYPEHGSQRIFRRALQAEPWREMRLELKAESTSANQAGVLWLIPILAGALAGIGSLFRRRG